MQGFYLDMASPSYDSRMRDKPFFEGQPNFRQLLTMHTALSPLQGFPYFVVQCHFGGSGRFRPTQGHISAHHGSG